MWLWDMLGNSTLRISFCLIWPYSSEFVIWTFNSGIFCKMSVTIQDHGLLPYGSVFLGKLLPSNAVGNEPVLLRCCSEDAVIKKLNGNAYFRRLIVIIIFILDFGV